MWYRFHRKDDARKNWDQADAALAEKSSSGDAEDSKPDSDSDKPKDE